MQRISAVTLAIALAAALAFPSPSRATELDPGGDDTGFIPPGTSALKCERYMNKRVTLASMCTLQCHTKYADKVFRGLPYDEDACEGAPSTASCKGKYDRSLGSVSPAICPPCIDDSAEYEALYTNYHDLADTTLSSLIYCHPMGNPFPDPAEGTVPMQKDIAKCTGKFARNVIKLIKCVNTKCHRNLADNLFAGFAYNEEDCEETDPINSCKARYEKANSKLVSCPPCLDQAHRDQVFETVEQALDSRNGLVYCAE